MSEINMLEAKTNLTKLIRDLEDKVEDEYIICRNGVPCARIVPYSRQKKKRVGCCEGKYPDISWEDWDRMDKDMEEYWQEWSEEKI